MKPLLFAFLLLSTVASAQTIEKNEVDEFTGVRIIETSWEPLRIDMLVAYYSRFVRRNDNLYMQVASMATSGSYTIIDTEDPIMLKMQNDSIVKLYPSEIAHSCWGCGSTGIKGSNDYGFKVTYIVPVDQEAIMIANMISKMRIYTSSGYYEETINQKRAYPVFNALRLIRSALHQQKKD